MYEVPFPSTQTKLTMKWTIIISPCYPSFHPETTNILEASKVSINVIDLRPASIGMACKLKLEFKNVDSNLSTTKEKEARRQLI